MKKNRQLHSFLVQLLTCGLLLTVGCITPFEPEFKEQPTTLVVQGFVSNEPGPYTIQIVRPANYSFKGYSIGVQKARVYITDESGEREQLIELPESGQYRTQSLQGKVGHTYQLHIEIDGKKYESKPELLREVPPIDRIYHESFENINPFTKKKQLGGWKVYIDTHDPAEKGNYYRWAWKHYKQTLYCGLATDRYGNPLYGLYCCNPRCWDIVRCLGPECINVANDALINGKNIARQLIAEVPVECLDRYYIEVEQQSLSREAYLYFTTTKRMLQNTGGVFDVAPSAIPGNMTCVTDPDEQVLGFFGAVGIARVGHYVDRRNADRVNCFREYPPPPSEGFPPPCAACEESLYRTNSTPRFWEF